MSKDSIESGWVEDEVNKGFAEERRRSAGSGRDVTVLIPVAIDDTFRHTTRPWAVKLRDSRYIQDFTSWKDPGAYRKSFERLLKALKLEQARV